MNDNNYIGITIGPIVDTLTSVSSPAGLWGVSYMFSYISRQICQKLLGAGIQKENFISPVFDLTKDEIKKNIGEVGLFPDRIIFKAPAGFEDIAGDNGLPKLIESVKNSLGTNLSKSISMDDSETKIIEFVNEYIQIHYVVLSEEEGNKDEKNCVLNISPYLDSIELSKTFPRNQTQNYFLNLFEGDSEKCRNERIKKSFLIRDADGSQILKESNEGNNEKKIKTINEIAYKNYSENNKPELKKYGYYAVVQADGDNIGKILKTTLIKDESVIEFSEKCLKYVAESSKIIKEYEGVTLYAGGDDLLFLSPVENSKKKTIFHLCKQLNCKFYEVFKNEIDTMKKKLDDGDEEAKTPSVSFGISIHHTKYPLYEALNEAQNLLFGVAKNTKNKNCIAFELTKSSGQKLGLVIPNNESFSNSNTILDCFLKVLTTFLGGNQEVGEKDKVLHSIIYKTAVFEGLLTIAANKDEVKIENLFNNIFDSEIHLGNAFIEEIRKLYEKICEDDKGIGISGMEGIEHRKKEVVILEYLLLLAKFFTEKAGERE
ncbi:MAG: type III-B CRISPR-associated protein Cas10/Cmr2 [Eubacteriaceae bacterium]